MRTDEIIDAHVNALHGLASTERLSPALDAFTSFCQKFEGEVSGTLPAGCPGVQSLKSDALFKLMIRTLRESVKSRGTQKWDREYVRSVYGASVDGADYVYYPARNAKRLVIHFSSMAKGKFDRYSRYWDESQQWDGDTAHLFFKDESQTYYLGTDERPMSGVYIRLIRQFRNANDLADHQVFTVGSSMGGYGALYYALTLGLAGAVVCAPQVTQRAMHVHTHQNWIRHARDAGTQWIDLDLLVLRTSTRPHVYLEVGRYAADRLAADSLVEALEQGSGLLVRRNALWTEHTRDSILPKDVVDQTLCYFEVHQSSSASYAA